MYSIHIHIASVPADMKHVAGIKFLVMRWFYSINESLSSNSLYGAQWDFEL